MPDILRKLLLSPHARTTGSGLKPADIDKPPKLRLRTSVEEGVFGPLSLRRQVNIRWRFFVQENRRVLPPIPEKTGLLKNLENLSINGRPGLSRKARYWRRRYAEVLARTPAVDDEGNIGVSPQALRPQRGKIKHEVASLPDSRWVEFAEARRPPGVVKQKKDDPVEM